MTPDPRDRLSRSALRATAADPARVGHWLARHRDAEETTDEALAAALRTDLRGLALLALCGTPRPDTFADDVRAVAAVAGADPVALANLLRQEQAVAAWVATPGSATSTGAGWLLAAHDADQPPPGTDDDPGHR